MPRLIAENTDKKSKPINSLMTFTDSEPTFKLADSNERAVAVQKTAVNSA